MPHKKLGDKSVFASAVLLFLIMLILINIANPGGSKYSAHEVTARVVESVRGEPIPVKGLGEEFAMVEKQVDVFEANNKVYTIEVTFISDFTESAVLHVNGHMTPALTKGSVYEIDESTYIYVRDLMLDHEPKTIFFSIR